MKLITYHLVASKAPSLGLLVREGGRERGRVTSQLVTWEQVEERSREDGQFQEFLSLLQQGAPEDRSSGRPD